MSFNDFDERWKHNASKSIKNGNEYKSDLNEIKRGKSKSNEQKSSLYNIETLCKPQNIVIKIFDDNFLMISEAKYKTILGKECSLDAHWTSQNINY